MFYIFRDEDDTQTKCNRLNCLLDLIEFSSVPGYSMPKRLTANTLLLLEQTSSSNWDEIETYLNVNVLTSFLKDLNNKEDVIKKKNIIYHMIKSFSPAYLLNIFKETYPLEGVTYRQYVHYIIECKPEFLPAFLIEVVKMEPEMIVKVLNTQLRAPEETRLSIYASLLNDYMNYMTEAESMLVNYIIRTIETDETLKKLIDSLSKNNVNKKLLNTLYDIITKRRFGQSAYALITKYDEMALMNNIKDFYFFDLMDIIIDYSHHYPEILMKIATNPNFAKFLNNNEIKTIFEEELLRMMPSSTNKHLIQNKKVVNYSWNEEEWINYIKALINHIFIFKNPNIKDIEKIIKDCLKKYPSNLKLIELISVFINKVNPESEIDFISILINLNKIEEALILLSKINTPSPKTIEFLDTHITNHQMFTLIPKLIKVTNKADLKCLEMLLETKENNDIYEIITEVIENGYLKKELLIKIIKSNNLVFIKRLLNIQDINIDYLIELIITYGNIDTLETIINSDNKYITKEVIRHYIYINEPDKVLKYYILGGFKDISILIKYYLDNNNIFGLKTCLDNDYFTEEEKEIIRRVLNRIGVSNNSIETTLSIEEFLLSNLDELLNIGLAEMVIEYKLDRNNIIHQMTQKPEKYREAAKIYLSFLNGINEEPSALDSLYFKTINPKQNKKLELN